MSLINVSNLTFSYAGSFDNVFADVNFQIDTNWKLGFIGRNGRGKTTFLQLLLKRYEYIGSITTDVDFAYFPFTVKDVEKDTIEVIQELSPYCEKWQIEKELSLLEVQEEALDRPFKSLSSGEQTKVLLAALFLQENSFLLIDEPTNHLDMKARQVVSNYLKRQKGFILVSHDRSFLDNCVDHILTINKANIEVQKGNFSSWLVNKERQDSFEMAENEKLKKDIKRLKQAAAKTSKWADKVEATKIGQKGPKVEKNIDNRAYVGEKSRRMQQRRKNLEHRQQVAVEEKSSLLKNIENDEKLKLSYLNHHTDRLVSLHDVKIMYGEKVACENVNFTVEKGDRIALCGKNGSGKSSVLKLICGEDIDYQGDFCRVSNLLVSYVSQDSSFLRGDLSDFALQNKIDESLFKTILRKLDFSRLQFEKDMQYFSAGQKKKVLIARSLCEQAHLYIWDELLNFIDIVSRMQIENLLLEYKPTILFVEHDKVFCDKIANKVINLTENKMIT